VRVEDGDTTESLAARIHAVEHVLLPATIRLVAAGKVRMPLPGPRVVQVDWSE
jgi:folate-dependent phosphoribosylglycinamide formyltransferase PurN